MALIPWRIKNFFSNNFTLLYYLLVNLNKRTNDADKWDKVLEDEWDSPKRQWPTLNRLIKELTNPSQTILDVACGTGHTLRYLNATGYKNLVGLEHSEFAINRLQGQGIQMIKGILPQIDSDDNTFEIVVASQILEHIIRRDKFLSEISRVMKPIGRALIFVPNDTLGPISEPGHCAIYNAKSLDKTLRRHFGTVTIEDFKDENFEMPILYACCTYPLA